MRGTVTFLAAKFLRTASNSRNAVDLVTLLEPRFCRLVHLLCGMKPRTPAFTTA
jgi:hypothetical protein